ncbi:MAG: hypothetical protein QOI21_4489 [Actinomycetota bacterium]|nr:hypothetical protein [Actinomycetota bacterium]
MSTQQAAPVLPEDRYGSVRAKQAPRWRRWVFTGVALVISAGLAFVAYKNLGSTPIDAQRVGFEARPGDSMQITLDVTRDDPGSPVVCVVRVQDVSGAESGRKEVLVPAGGDPRRVSTVIRSTGQPVNADVFGCSYDVPRYLSSP